MTAEELWAKHFDGLHYDDITPEKEQKYAIEFAKFKCKELLEIVVEKAIIKTQKKSVHGKNRKWQNIKEGEEFDLFQYEMKSSVDKNSILNAVDLNEFIR